jgi:hypothetical protein
MPKSSRLKFLIREPSIKNFLRSYYVGKITYERLWDSLFFSQGYKVWLIDSVAKGPKFGRKAEKGQKKIWSSAMPFWSRAMRHTNSIQKRRLASRLRRRIMIPRYAWYRRIIIIYCIRIDLGEILKKKNRTYFIRESRA